MNYVIEKDSSIPAYHQIYEMLRQDIINAVYGYGDKLPSKRVITARTGVSVITVEHALAMLDEEGYIESRQRSGYYVCYRRADFGAYGIRNAVSSYSESVSVVRTETDDDAISFDMLSKTMRKVILNYGDVLLQKSENFGCDFLREEIQKYMARSRGILVDREQIIIGSGAEYLYGMIAGMFRDRQNFAIEDPSYSKIRLVYETGGRTVIPLPIEDNGIPSEYLAELDADILHVTPFHSFPTGATADVSKRNEYIDWAERCDGYLVEDNYDSELTISRKSEESLFSMNSERVIYINTFSKTIAPSVRVGYMILPKQLLKRFVDIYGEYSSTVPLFEQLVLAELIRSGNFERHINRLRRARRRALKDNKGH